MQRDVTAHAAVEDFAFRCGDTKSTRFEGPGSFPINGFGGFASPFAQTAKCQLLSLPLVTRMLGLGQPGPPEHHQEPGETEGQTRRAAERASRRGEEGRR